MEARFSAPRVLGCAICVLAAWVLHDFVEAILAACVIAVASWPSYEWFARRIAPRASRGTAGVLFTCVLTVVVLAPLAFACWALLGEARFLVHGLLEAEKRGLVPQQLLQLTQHADAAVIFGWARKVGDFTLRTVLIVAFAVLLLCFLYREGESLVRALRDAIGPAADRYLDAAARATRGVVTSMFVVGVFDACATAIAFALAGLPRGLVWAAVIGALAAIPFLGYLAVAAMAAELALGGAGSAAGTSLLLGCGVLLAGDKLVRPAVARGDLHLPFVWVLMGCIGGFSVLGLAGLVVGPVVLSLAREMYEQRITPTAACRA